MANVFVSHSSKDYSFVSLLVSLLEYHYIDTWCSPSDIEPGTHFPRKIEQALKDTNVLIVVVTKNAATSKWVAQEITIFQTQKPDALVVPLLFDPIDLDTIVPGLSSYQAIDFSKSMLAGCESLFPLLGKEFLSYRNRRNASSRRTSPDRRMGDRRRSPFIQRMRKGLWKAYALETGHGEFEELIVGVREHFRVKDTLREEVLKYEYLDAAGQQCDPQNVLENSTYRVWNIMKNRGGIKAIYLIEAIAEEIYHQYKVKGVARRDENRRSSGNRRG